MHTLLNLISGIFFVASLFIAIGVTNLNRDLLRAFPPGRVCDERSKAVYRQVRITLVLGKQHSAFYAFIGATLLVLNTFMPI